MCPRGVVGRAARLCGEPGHRDPEELGSSDDIQGHVRDAKLHVGGAGLAVEIEWEVVRRKDLAKGDRRGEFRTGDDKVIHDPEPNHLAPDESAEGVVTDAGQHGCRVAHARGSDCDVRRAPAQELTERLDVLEADTGLQWVDVHPRPADGHNLHV